MNNWLYTQLNKVDDAVVEEDVEEVEVIFFSSSDFLVFKFLSFFSFSLFKFQSLFNVGDGKGYNDKVLSLPP